MKLQIGKVYKLKNGTLGRLQGIGRSIVHHRENEVRHFVEISFNILDVDEFGAYKVLVPFSEILPSRTADDKELIKAISDAIVSGSPIPVAGPRDQSEAP